VLRRALDLDAGLDRPALQGDHVGHDGHVGRNVWCVFVC
jgi:hypothetical protein